MSKTVIILVILSISVAFGAAQSKTAQCLLKNATNGKYTCELSNINITELGEAINITAKHWKMKDEDVRRIEIAYGQTMRFIPFEIFFKFANMEDVIINNVLLQQIDYVTFFNCSDVETIDLSHNIIEYIPGGVFVPCENLKRINLTDNYLTITDDVFLINLQLLSTLKFENNYLGSENQLKPFVAVQSLAKLDLTNNEILTLPSNLIHKVSHLTTLKLSYNYISSIPRDFFNNSSFLQILELDKNRLSLLLEKPFVNLKSLVVLDLQYNVISYIHCDLFSTLKKLEKLRLSGNLIHTICPTAFDSFENLYEFDIAFNYLSNSAHHPQVPLHCLENLEFLDLSYNQIDYLDRGFGLSENSELADLLLNNNRIYFIYPKMFEDLVNLYYLDLSSNRLIALSSETFDMNQNLRTLLMANNNFTRLDADLLEPMIELVTLNFNYNQINQIDPQLAGFFVSKKVNLVGNACYSRDICRILNVSTVESILKVCFDNFDTDEKIEMPMPPKQLPRIENLATRNRFLKVIAAVALLILQFA